MKKFIRSIFLAILLIPICLGFWGCKKDPTDPETPKPTPPPTLNTVINTIDDIIVLEDLSTTIRGSASLDYLKSTDNVTDKTKSYNIEDFTVKANDGKFYLNLADDKEYYMIDNVVYARDYISGDTYSNWSIKYNNVLENIFEKRNGLENLEKFLEPVIFGIIENLESFNGNWTTCRNLNNGGYGLDINISLTSMLNKIQDIIKETYSESSREKTIEAVINKILAEKYDDITVESLIIELFGDGTTNGFVKENTNIRNVLEYLDEKFGLDTTNVVKNMLNTYYLIQSTTGTDTSARISTNVILETTIYSAIMTLKNFVFDTDDLVTEITAEDVRESVNDIVEKYLRSETYTIEYLCDKIEPTINKLLDKNLDLYDLITNFDIDKVDLKLTIETNADKTQLALITGDLDIKLGKTVASGYTTKYSRYSLDGEFNLTFSNWNSTIVTQPSIDGSEAKNVDIYLIVSDLYENSSYTEVLEIPHIKEDIEIVKGEHKFRYTVSNNKVYISPLAVNSLLGIVDGNKVDNPDRTMSFSAEISATLTVTVKILYLPKVI